MHFCAIEPDSFGQAVKDLNVYLWFHREPEGEIFSLYERFEANRRLPPRAWFKRKKRRYEIAYASQLGTWEDVIKWESEPVQLQNFRNACEEIATAIKVNLTKIKANDEFDKNNYCNFLDQKLREIPKSADRLQLLIQHLEFVEKQNLLP